MRPYTWVSLRAVLWAAIAGSALAQDPKPQASPDVVFPAGVEQVTVDVLVLDGRGQPVEGLRREDFTVKEDGRAQAITAFEAVRVPEFAPTPSRTRVSTNVLARPAVERSFVIVFDDANITQYSTARARQAMSEFIRKGLGPGDEVMIVPTTGGAWWTGRSPSDRESLLAYVQRLEGKYRPDAGAGRIWDHEAMAIWMGRDPQVLSQVARRWFENNLIPESYPSADRQTRADLDVSPGLALIRAKAQEVYRSAVGRLRLTLDVLARVAESLDQLRGRKNLLLVSEGFIMDPSQPEFRQVVQAARRANAAIHFLDAGGAEGAVGKAGMPGGNAESGRGVEERDTTTVLALAVRATEGARSVAADTGGSVVPATGGLGDAMARIAQESRAYYLIGYNSTNTKRDGSFRKLSVEVARPGVDIRARRGYYAPKDGEQRKEDPDRLDPRVRAALDAPVAAAALPLRLTSYMSGAAVSGKMPVLLLAEADVAALGLEPKGGKVSAALETYLVVHARDTGELQKQEKLMELDVPAEHWDQVRRGGVAVRRELELAPGVYQARLLVRHRESGRLGTVRHEFEVPRPQGLRTSTPVLTDTFQAGSAEALPRPVPVARRVFPAGSRLGYAYEVYGASPDPVAGGPKVSAGYVVRKADGTAVASGPTRPLKPAGLDRLGQVVLFMAPAEPGDYEFVLDVRDEAGAVGVQVVDPFTLVAAPPRGPGGQP
jgi:VWFA-related protein